MDVPKTPPPDHTKEVHQHHYLGMYKTSHLSLAHTRTHTVLPLLNIENMHKASEESREKQAYKICKFRQALDVYSMRSAKASMYLSILGYGTSSRSKG